MTNFLTDAPQNGIDLTDKALDFSVLESNASLGYTHYTLSFEGSGTGTRGGTASLYFLPTGEADTADKRFYLLTDTQFGDATYNPSTNPSSCCGDARLRRFGGCPYR